MITAAADTGAETYCSFRVEDHWFAVPARTVREVHSAAELTPIPAAPPAVLGYVNLRGQLFLVLSAGRLLLGSREACAADPHLVVFRSEVGELFALQTGPVGDIVGIRRDQIDIPATNASPDRLEGATVDGSRLIVGHAKLEHALLALINPHRLLEAAFSGDSRL